MVPSQELEVQEKKEVVGKDEATVPARYFLPNTDIYENDEALTVIMEVPGVVKDDLDVSVENDVLRVQAKINFANYGGLEPLYTEYNVGHFARSFTLSNKLDQQQISAHLEDGVLTLVLKKAKEAQPRRIAIN
jgi:HSP20 family molecular chaperone IbpA